MDSIVLWLSLVYNRNNEMIPSGKRVGMSNGSRFEKLFSDGYG